MNRQTDPIEASLSDPTNDTVRSGAAEAASRPEDRPQAGAPAAHPLPASPESGATRQAQPVPEPRPAPSPGGPEPAPQPARTAPERPEHVPVQRPEDVHLRFPEGLEPDPGARAGFCRLCVEQGLSTAQAQALLDWQIQTDRELTEAALRRGTAELRGRWGSRFEENAGLALRAVTALDRRLEGRLSEALAATGLHNHPVLVETFHAVGALLAEDALCGDAAAGPEVRESAEQTYKHMFRR